MTPDVSILIVNYNTRELTLACLRSVYAETRGPEFEVILVDNASADASSAAIRAEFPQVRLIESDTNLGFARANNLAATHARGRYLCLLNSDTVVQSNAISTLLRFAEAHPQAGAFGGRTSFADGRLNPASCWAAPTLASTLFQSLGLASTFPNSSLFNSEAIAGWDRSTPRAVDIISGCFLLISRDLWNALDGFDPAFFMYAEDADLGARLRARGYECLICPDARIIHYGGASERVRADSMTRLFRAKSQYFARHWRSAAAQRLGVRLFDLWALIRWTTFSIFTLVRRRHADRARIWRDIWRRRAEWHVFSSCATQCHPVMNTALEPSHV